MFSFVELQQFAGLLINSLCYYLDMIQVDVGIEMLESLLSNLGPEVSS
jgi:hypothetical protein